MKLRWPWVLRSRAEQRLENERLDAESYKRLWGESFNKGVDRKRSYESEKKRLNDQLSQMDSDRQALLTSLGEYFPIHWDWDSPHHRRGYIVLSSCPECKRKADQERERLYSNRGADPDPDERFYCNREAGQEREWFSNLSELVSSLLEKVANGQRHESVLCHRCSPLDVTEGEGGMWRVVTAICQIGGCDASYAEFDSKDEAEDYAKRFYESGGRLSYHGLCLKCASEYREMCS